MQERDFSEDQESCWFMITANPQSTNHVRLRVHSLYTGTRNVLLKFRATVQRLKETRWNTQLCTPHKLYLKHHLMFVMISCPWHRQSFWIKIIKFTCTYKLLQETGLSWSGEHDKPMLSRWVNDPSAINHITKSYTGDL